MSLGWVASVVRVRLLLDRRLGPDGALEAAGSGSLAAAVAFLASSPYGRELRDGASLPDARRAVAASLLWDLRVLAGWLPPSGVVVARAMAGWFEVANVAERLAYLAGGGTPPAPFDLGGLAVAWPRLARSLSAHELRTTLAGSAWGDPGSDGADDILLAMRLAWGRRLLVAAPETAAWVAGASALTVAREDLAARRGPSPLDRSSPPGLTAGWVGAAAIPELAERLPKRAAWPLDGVGGPAELWRGEAAWWSRVERDAEAMTRSARLARVAFLGAVTLLALDARRAAVALDVAARGSPPELVREFGGPP